MKNSTIRALLLTSLTILWQTAAGWADGIDCSPCSQKSSNVCQVSGNSISELNQCLKNYNNSNANYTICMTSSQTFDFQSSSDALTTLNRWSTLTICGNGSTLKRSGTDSLRFLNQAQGSLEIQSLTFNNGSVSGNGGAISQTNSGGYFLTIEDSTFVGNSAGNGGAVYQSGGNVSLNLTNSTFVGNSAGNGGAIYQTGSGGNSLTFKSLTLQNNTGGGSGAIYQGGTGNHVTITNSIITDSCSPALPSGGHNLTTGDCFSPGGSGDIITTADKMNLAPALWYRGGPTPTLALKAGSPAIGKGSCSAISTDQRDVARPNPSGSCDIGAYQSYCDAQTTDNLLKISLTVDFDHHGGGLDAPWERYSMVTSDNCLNDIADNVDTIEWSLDAFGSTLPQNDDEFQIANIFYTAEEVASYQGLKHKPTPGSCPDDVTCLECVSTDPPKDPRSTKLVWTTQSTLPFVLYTQPWTPALKTSPSHSRQLTCCPNNRCSGKAESNELDLYYTIEWAGEGDQGPLIDSGDWDPRMCPRVVSTGPL